MAFNSVYYLLSLFILVFIYYICPFRFKWILLLIASIIFYMAWSPILIILMLFVVFINYLAALLIDKFRDNKKKILIIALLINFGILFTFKYAVFINESFFILFQKFAIYYPIPKFDIILPMGISFYTFQACGYTIDVYRNDIEVEKNFFKLSLFITFFPQLVAGPIERTSALMPQLFKDSKFKLENMIIGSKYMIFGYFKKVVIADRLSKVVNTIFNNPSSYEGIHFIIASFFFAIQVYCDFSAYSEIAKGSAKFFDIDLMENFRTPYFARGIKDFWRRWHISLSTWFKDYLYIPLGGNRVSVARQHFNTMITFLVSGLWHGANWTFFIWGALHGFFQILEYYIRKPIDKLLDFFKIKDFIIIRIIEVIFTFLIVVFAYIFFRANTVSDAFFIIKNLFTNFDMWTNKQYLFDVFNNLGISFFEVIISMFSILVLFLSEISSTKEDIHQVLAKKPFALNFLFYLFIAALIFCIGVFYDAGAFIYFQF